MHGAGAACAAHTQVCLDARPLKNPIAQHMMSTSALHTSFFTTAVLMRSAQQRDMLAAKLVEAAYLGVSSAASGRDLGAPLPALSALTHQHPQQLEPYAHNGITSHGPMFESLERDRSTSHGPGSEGVPGPRHASPQGGSEAVDGTRKRRAEAPPESPGSQPKRQQTEQGPAEQLAVSSAAPAGNVASLMTSLEQEVWPVSHSKSNCPRLGDITQTNQAACFTFLFVQIIDHVYATVIFST